MKARLEGGRWTLGRIKRTAACCRSFLGGNDVGINPLRAASDAVLAVAVVMLAPVPAHADYVCWTSDGTGIAMTQATDRSRRSRALHQWNLHTLRLRPQLQWSSQREAPAGAVPVQPAPVQPGMGPGPRPGKRSGQRRYGPSIQHSQLFFAVARDRGDRLDGARSGVGRVSTQEDHFRAVAEGASRFVPAVLKQPRPERRVRRRRPSRRRPLCQGCSAGAVSTMQTAKAPSRGTEPSPIRYRIRNRGPLGSRSCRGCGPAFWTERIGGIRALKLRGVVHLGAQHPEASEFRLVLFFRVVVGLQDPDQMVQGLISGPSARSTTTSP